MQGQVSESVCIVDLAVLQRAFVWKHLHPELFYVVNLSQDSQDAHSGRQGSQNGQLRGLYLFIYFKRSPRDESDCRNDGK